MKRYGLLLAWMLLIGNGSGWLCAQGKGLFGDIRYRTGRTRPVAISVGDFNRDMIQDLAVVNYGAPPALQGSVSIFQGLGNGRFEPRDTYRVGFGPRAIAIADFNGDMRPDLAVASLGDIDGYQQHLILYMGLGDGRFQTMRRVALDARPRFVTAGDVNVDGFPDLVAATPANDSVFILLTHGGSLWEGSTGTEEVAVISSPTAIAVGDFNGDDFPDLAVTTEDDLVCVRLHVAPGT